MAHLADSHLLATLQLGTFTLLAIPYSSFEPHLPPSLSGTARLDVKLDVACPSNPEPPDISGLGVLRYNLVKPTESGAGYSAIAIHSFVPNWRESARLGSEVPEEIFVVGSDRLETNTPDILASWRFQLARGPPIPSLESDSYFQHSSLQTAYYENPWRLTLISSGRAPTSSLPWNPQCITNAGRMLSLYNDLSSFTLFCNDEPQPATLLSSGEAALIDHYAAYSLETMDPYSGALAIQTPAKVRIVEFV